MPRRRGPALGATPFSCSVCGARFGSLQALGGHKSAHNPKRSPLSLEDGEEQRKRQKQQLLHSWAQHLRSLPLSTSELCSSPSVSLKACEPPPWQQGGSSQAAPERPQQPHPPFTSSRHANRQGFLFGLPQVPGLLAVQSCPQRTEGPPMDSSKGSEHSGSASSLGSPVAAPVHSSLPMDSTATAPQSMDASMGLNSSISYFFCPPYKVSGVGCKAAGAPVHDAPAWERALLEEAASKIRRLGGPLRVGLPAAALFSPRLHCAGAQNWINASGSSEVEKGPSPRSCTDASSLQDEGTEMLLQGPSTTSDRGTTSGTAGDVGDEFRRMTEGSTISPDCTSGEEVRLPYPQSSQFYGNHHHEGISSTSAWRPWLRGPDAMPARDQETEGPSGLRGPSSFSQSTSTELESTAIDLTLRLSL